MDVGYWRRISTTRCGSTERPCTNSRIQSYTHTGSSSTWHRSRWVHVLCVWRWVPVLGERPHVAPYIGCSGYCERSSTPDLFSGFAVRVMLLFHKLMFRKFHSNNSNLPGICFMALFDKVCSVTIEKPGIAGSWKCIESAHILSPYHIHTRQIWCEW